MDRILDLRLDRLAYLRFHLCLEIVLPLLAAQVIRLEAAREEEAVLARAIKREKTKPGKHGFYELPRLHVPGFPTEAFILASEAVAAALAREGFGFEDEPPPGLRLPILRAALEQGSSGPQ